MIQFSQRELDALRRHAEQAYPRECCGILLGHRRGEVRIVAEVVPCENMVPPSSAVRSYLIAPQELIRAQREGRERALEIVGFYHSHPDHPAQWSSSDLEEACWPGCSYVIIGIARGRAAETRSFALLGSEDDRHFDAEPLEMLSPVN